MLSKKSFLADEQNFSAPLVGPMLGNVRDHIESRQNDTDLVHAIQRLAATETTKTDVRDFRSSSTFDFFDSIGESRKSTRCTARPFHLNKGHSIALHVRVVSPRSVVRVAESCSKGKRMGDRVTDFRG